MVSCHITWCIYNIFNYTIHLKLLDYFDFLFLIKKYKNYNYYNINERFMGRVKDHSKFYSL